MSDRLAVSASLSVLMMSIFVLFGSDVARAPIGPGQLSAPHSAPTAGPLGGPVQLLTAAR